MSSILSQIGELFGGEVSRLDQEIEKSREIVEVADLTARDALLAAERYDDMWVKTLGGVDAQGDSTADKIFYLKGGLTNLHWVDLFAGVQAPASNNSIDAAFLDGKDSSEWIQEIDSRVATRALVGHVHDNLYLALNGIAANSSKLEGFGASYFAEATRVNSLETLLQSNDVNLDNLQEVVSFVKDNRDLINGLTPEGIGAAHVNHNHIGVYYTEGAKVADSYKVNGLTVDTAVPAGAEFTDTVYNHPASHPITMVAGLTDALAGKATTAAVEGKADSTHTHAEYANDPSTVIDSNYVHSDNNFTDLLETKLAGIQEGANAYTHPAYHEMTKITGLSGALDGKSDTGHGHATGDVSGLDAALAGKAASAHGHGTSEVTGLDDALSGMQMSIQSILDSMSTDAERLAAVQALTTAFQSADGDLNTAITTMVNAKMDINATIDGGTY
jgi:hypothetical protein